MNIYVYSDESGVFDRNHERFFVFGGLMLFSKNEVEIANRKYIHAEHCIRNKYTQGIELKACAVTNKDKGKLYRALNKYVKFGVIIDMPQVLESVYNHKKSKQRFLDYAYKIGLKRVFEFMFSTGVIASNEVDNLNIFVDEHSTATNGRYELREGIEQEFKFGTHNDQYSVYYKPIIPTINCVNLEYCNSSVKTLIRAADIIANNLYHKAYEKDNSVFTTDNLHVITLPNELCGNRLRNIRIIISQ